MQGTTGDDGCRGRSPRHRRHRGAVACLLVVGACALLAAAAPPVAGAPAGLVDTAPLQDDEEQPRAEAGVDQTVTRNATVLLDGTQSWSPAGEIETYEWTVEAPPNASAASPGNGTFEPTCETDACGLAHFRAPAFGTYAVHLTVTDEAGRSRSDTMYVTTEAGNQLGVDLDGTEASNTLTANVTAGNATLQTLRWYGPGGHLENQSISGLGDTYERDTSIADGATYAVTVHTADGRVVGDGWTASTSDALRDYPFIWGPEELTGDADYDTDNDEYTFRSVTYRIRTRGEVQPDEVKWSKNGEEVATGVTFTDDFVAGEHELTATLQLSHVSLERLSQGSDGAAGMIATTTGHDTARLQVVANPEPQFRATQLIRSEESVSYFYRVREPYQSIERIELQVGSEVINSREISRGEDRGQLSGPIPDAAEGGTSVSIVAEDSTGQEAAVSDSIYIRTPSNDTSDENGSPHPCNDPERSVCSKVGST